MQRQARRKQMIKATETASVVITNPTHYAVALKFEMSMPAPIVVAKGLDLLAAKIKEIARDRDIPIMENRPLAQALYKTVEVGDAIPAALYHAVAEILVLVYKAQQEVQRREAQRRASANIPIGVTPVNKKPGLLATIRASSDWFIPTGAVALVFVMLVPLPSFVLDLLLTLSITASVLVLLTAIQILRPVQFSVFPSLILLLTLMRLSLDLASTRRILLHGSEGTSAAGKVIEAFGQFVVGGNYIVGFVIFIALIAIQYLVVSHGAVRTAEVTARFTLDAMPGKQMAIDSDLNTGLINADQARLRREQVAREAEFCGSMDGAARFSQRDSLATILILVINIVAGFLIGVFQHGMPFQQALKTYTILTVGNGLVSIIPSLLVSVARWHRGHPRGFRSLPRRRHPKADASQLRAPLWIVSGVLLALALIPGMPKISFIALGGITMFAAWKMKPSVETEAVRRYKAAPGKGGAAGYPGHRSYGRGAEAGRVDARGRRWPRTAGRCEAGRSVVGAREVAAQESCAATRIPGSLDSHHRQPLSQRA